MKRKRWHGIKTEPALLGMSGLRIEFDGRRFRLLSPCIDVEPMVWDYAEGLVLAGVIERVCELVGRHGGRLLQ